LQAVPDRIPEHFYCNKSPERWAGRIMSVTSSQGTSRLFLFFLMLALMVALMNSSAPTPLYPFYKEHLQLHAVDLTYIFGAYGAGVLLSLSTVASIAGRMKDLRLLLAPAAFLVFIGAELFAQGSSLWQLCAARLVSGLGAGALTSGINVALVRFGPTDDGKLAALLATLAMVTGLALGPVLSGAALQWGLYPIALPFWTIMVLISVVTLGLLLLWPRKTQAPPANASEGKAASLRGGLKGIGRRFHVYAWSVFFSWSFAACVFVMGPNAAEQLLGVSDRGAFGYVIAIYLLFAGISQLVCQRLEAWQALVSGLLAQSLAFLTLMVGFDVHSLWLSIAGLLIGGYAYGAIFVGSARLINQLAPAHCHAKLVSYFYMTVYLFNAVPIPLGLMVDAFGISRAVTGSLITFLVIGILLFVVTIKNLSSKHPLPA
jgi:MFS family permease